MLLCMIIKLNIKFEITDEIALNMMHPVVKGNLIEIETLHRYINNGMKLLYCQHGLKQTKGLWSAHLVLMWPQLL